MDLPVYELMISDDFNDDAEVNFVSLVDRPATQMLWNSFAHKVKFNTDEEKRVISGAIMLADTPIFRSDVTHGDYYVIFSKDTIFKIVQRYFKKGYQANVNIQHNQDKQIEGVYLFESFISDKQRGVMPMKGFEDAPNGSWFGSMKVDNDFAWNEVKEGNIKGFSVEGIFEYSKKPNKEEILMAQIYKILKDVDFGGEGSGCQGDNCGRPKGDVNSDSVSNNTISKTKEEADVNEEKWAKTLSDKEKDVIKEYTGGDYGKINDYLRNGTEIDSNLKDNINVLSKTLDNAPKFSGEVYRGNYFNSDAQLNNFKEQFKVGETYTDKSFMSTTSNKDVVDLYYNDKNFVSTMNIKSKSGVSINSLSYYTNENEVLFNKGSKFKVDNVREENVNGVRNLIIDLSEN
jgi:hypothetical protein